MVEKIMICDTTQYVGMKVNKVLLDATTGMNVTNVMKEARQN